MNDNRGKNILTVWDEKNKVNIPNKEVQLEVINQIASIFSAGPFYYYVFNFVTRQVDFVHEGIKDVLGIEPDEFSIQKLFDIMHDDTLYNFSEREAISTEFLFNKIPIGDIPFYKVSSLLGLKDNNGNYKTILHQSKALTISADEKIQQVLCVDQDLTYLNIPYNNKVSFIGYNKPSYYAIESKGVYQICDNHILNNFTKRELEIIGKLAEGKTYKEIAEQLFVSPHTINTHKKNILRKAECKNTAELIGKCLTEGVI